MRDEALYLDDIVEAAESLTEFLKNTDKDAFLTNDLLRSAVTYKLLIIGEAASHVSPELRDRHPEVEWRNAIGFRNVATHTYFGINWNTVWSAAMYDAPTLAAQIAHILEEEFPDEEGEDSQA